MSHPTLTIIRAEHQALSAMLTSLSMLLAEYRHKGSPPDFRLLQAMLLYVDEFPEKLHHTKESELLFPLLRARSPEATEILDRLDREHANGEKAIRDLEHELLAFEVLGGSRGTNFEQSANRYVEFYLAHMALEETEVLPLAKRRCNRGHAASAASDLDHHLRRPSRDRGFDSAAHDGGLATQLSVGQARRRHLDDAAGRLEQALAPLHEDAVDRAC